LTKRVMVIGGYGVFGSRLVLQLLRTARLEVVVAGRDQAKLNAFCSQFGATPCRLDRDSDAELDRALRELSPGLIVDADGPFQMYGADRYRLARKAIEARSTISTSRTTGVLWSDSRNWIGSPKNTV
jgi:short subunit dehydrogenase-like uncharacterized protein